MSELGKAKRRVYLCAGLISISLLALVVFSGRVTKPVTAQEAPPVVPNIPAIPPGSAYRQTNFISDIPGLAPILDPLMVNPWGIAESASSPFWIVNAGTSTTQIIRGDVSGAPVVLNPASPGPQTVNIPGGLPTGVVRNSTSDFVINPPATPTPPPAPAPAQFIFASITGTINAWNGASGTSAQNQVSMPGHGWTGLAIGASTTPAGNRLYAADFELNHIDVFNGTFTPTTVTGGFIDATVPSNYHPHNIQNIGGSLYVTYAMYDASISPSHRATGVGLGLVRKFNTDGVRDPAFAISDVSSVPSSQLNAPWGLAIAPASFGIFGGALLVGNFGEGNASIHAYNPTTGAVLSSGTNPFAELRNENDQGIEIDELWALQFGNGGSGGDVNTLYFTSGIGEEEHGLFGKLNPTTATATSLIEFASDSAQIDEAGGHVDVTVIRTGDTSGTASINYNTFDESRVGHASQKSDYEISLGKLTFNPGETSKTFRILLVDDNFDEDDEVIDLALSNPTGTGVGLGSPNVAEVKILDNDTGAPATNPIDNSSFFVRQHYLDFLNREPDPAGLAFWINTIESCGPSPSCRDTRRTNASAAFFLSDEFQKTGLEVWLTHRAAFGSTALGGPPGVPVFYGTFERDQQALGKDFIVGQPGADAQLEANKVAFFNEFVTRPQFVSSYPATLTNAQYVDNLLASAGLSPANTRLFVVNMTNAAEVPPTVPTTTGGAARPASFGTAKLLLNPAQTALTLTATINNIDVGGQSSDTNDNLISAHIHAGPSVTVGVNGPVVWGFFGNPFNDNNPNDLVFSPFSSGVGGNFSAKWDAPEGNGTTLAAQLANLRSGAAYVNFHTLQFPGGEIRGYLQPENAFRDSLVNGLNAATETRATVLRKIAEAEELKLREFNGAFVAMEYFAYLRRDPDTSGYNFWLNKLNAFNGNFIASEMVKSFLASSEYRQRFGPS